MTNDNQSDAGQVKHLADKIQSTLAPESTDTPEQDLDNLLHQIRLSDESADYSDDLLDSNLVFKSEEEGNSEKNEDNFDTPLFWEKYPRVFTLSVVLILVAFIGGFILYLKKDTPTANYSVNHLPDNVYVAGINIGGMTPSQAETALEHNIPLFAQKSVEIRFREDSLILTPEDLEFSLDIDSTIKKAALATGSSRVDLDIQSEAHLNLPHVRSLIETVFADEESSFVQSSYRLEGVAPSLDFEHYDPQSNVQTLILNPGVPGSTLDPNEVFRAFTENYLKGNLLIEIAEPDNNRIPDELNLDNIYRTLTIQAVSSRISADGESFLPGSFGYTFSLEDAKKALAGASYGSEVSLPMKLVYPEFEKSPLFPDVLSSVVLPCDPNTLPNVRIGCHAVNGVIVKTGNEFSMKDCFKNVFADSDCRNEPVEDDGICMVASTLYHSALLAGMNSTSVSRHNYVVSFTEPCYDVHFTQRGSNLRFQNSTGNPILVLTSFADDGIHVQILGTEYRSYSIELVSKDAKAKPFKTETKTVRLADGYAQGQVIRQGINGYVGTLELVKRSKETGEVLSTDVIRNLFYEPLPELVANIVG